MGQAMQRMIMGAISASLFAVTLLLLAGPPSDRVIMDRPAARVAMATSVLSQIEMGLGRVSAVLQSGTGQNRDSDTPIDVALLCQDIARDADAVVRARLHGDFSYDQMIRDAGKDPVLAWLVTLAWTTVPQAGDATAAARYHTIVARDCVQAFA